MSIIENATNSVQHLPKGVWLASIGVGGGIGVLYLIRHRSQPPASSDPNASDVANTYTTPLATPDFSSSAGFAGDGSVGGASLGAYDPQAVVQPGTNPIPLSGVVDLLTTLWGLQPPGAADTGGGMPTADPTEVHTTPPSVPPAVSPALPTAVPTIPKPSSPPTAAQAYAQQWTNAAQSTGTGPFAGQAPSTPAPGRACPPTHPFDAGGGDCYRVVLKGKERWHYHLDGRQVKVS